MQQKKILLIEDNDDYAKVANKVLDNYMITRAENYLEAHEKIKQNNYDFYIVDGFFSYGKTMPEETIDELFAVEEAFNKMRFEYYAEILATGQDNGWLPMGALLARDLKNKGIENYLICSAANNHSYTYPALEKIADEWELKLYLSNDYGRQVPIKTTEEYWTNVKKTIDEKLL